MTTATATLPRGPQHMQALARANKVRLARADLKRRVGLGELSAAEVVLDSPWEAESMTISDLLLSQRRWGNQRARKLLMAIPMSEHKTIGSMTQRQRLAVAEMLGSVAPSPEAAPAPVQPETVCSQAPSALTPVLA